MDLIKKLIANWSRYFTHPTMGKEGEFFYAELPNRPTPSVCILLLN
jgi:hypothetical protein